jgi:FdrA protein
MPRHAFEHPGGFACPSNHQEGHIMTDAKKIEGLFQEELVVINMGLDAFADALRKEKVKVLQMNWKPPAGGDQRIISFLDRVDK